MSVSHKYSFDWRAKTQGTIFPKGYLRRSGWELPDGDKRQARCEPGLTSAPPTRPKQRVDTITPCAQKTAYHTQVEISSPTRPRPPHRRPHTTTSSLICVISLLIHESLTSWHRTGITDSLADEQYSPLLRRGRSVRERGKRQGDISSQLRSNNTQYLSTYAA